jgi:hypothetical protein
MLKLLLDRLNVTFTFQRRKKALALCGAGAVVDAMSD